MDLPFSQVRNSKYKKYTSWNDFGFKNLPPNGWKNSFSFLEVSLKSYLALK